MDEGIDIFETAGNNRECRVDFIVLWAWFGGGAKLRASFGHVLGFVTFNQERGT
jgi:hypothetical protein